MAIQRKRKVTRMYQIEVNYKEDQLSAEFHCPLCDKDWRYPFTIREIYGHLRRRRARSSYSIYMVVAPIHNPVQDSTSVCPHRFSFSGSYELPFGNGKMFLKDARGLVNQAVSGWQLNIINNLRSGFPFTPALGFNWSRDGNTSAPDRPSFAPGRTLHGIYLRRPKQWVDPTAFVLPQ